LKYRAEIDGLRALAVVPVILFHAGFEWFSGGFIGVDVFFVISGYLITKIIIEDIENNRFSVLNFYEKRARRILPALFFVMLACIPFAWAWMLPDPLENFGQSYIATTFFANNILLFITSGYWDLASEFKPLLHTWSLGVEEQYYIAFPAFLLLTWHLGKNKIFWMIVLLSIISLSLSEWSSKKFPTANFYLAPTRAWELLAGSLTAFIIHKTGVRKNELLSMLGLAAIVFSLFVFDETTPFPSIYALIPVVCVTLILLYANAETLVARLLSTKTLVGVGLISYSAYLWHQPLFAFAKIFSKTEPTLLVNFLLITTTLLISFVTWQYIEKPFRDRKIVSRKLLIISLTSTSFFLILFGASAHKTHGFASRVFSENISVDDMYISYNSRNFSFKQDTFESNNNPNILVVGNSFGRDFVNILRETYNISSYNLVYRDDFDSCSLLDQGIGMELLNDANIVILASNYDISKTLCNQDLINFVETRDSHIFFIGTKQFGINNNWITRVSTDERKLLRNPILSETIKSDNEAINAIPKTNYISLMQPLLNEEGVLVTDEKGRLISPDRAHLTKYGAIFIGRKIISDSLLHSLLSPNNNRH